MLNSFFKTSATVFWLKTGSNSDTTDVRLSSPSVAALAEAQKSKDPVVLMKAATMQVIETMELMNVVKK